VTFLFVGRLLRNKGLQEFVQACRILYEAKVPVRCLILGALDSNPNGITAAQLAIWVQEGFVEYLGEVQDVRPVLAKAHVLVLPSYGEGTPRSVLEAMAMGRAVVTTNSPGCRDAVQDDCNGLLVPVGDAQALAAAMTRLAQDVGSIARMAAEGLRLAEQKYDVRLVTQEILDFMDVRPK
jgi:glycosyltransferase involved in cell wall biosynthesis